MSSARIGRPAGERRGVVGRPLIDQPAVARRPGEQDPARAAAERLAHRGELSPPALEAPEVPGQSIDELGARLALLTEAVEEHLVQDHRVHRDELLALEPVHDEAGRGGEVEPGQLLLDQVQALHRAAVIVLVVADDQPLGHALDPGRVAGERLHLVRHGGPPQAVILGGQLCVSPLSSRHQR